MVKVLFVCMGNICRSPTAEGVFTKLVENANLSEKIGIDSAGTHAYHVGEPPDKRASSSALARGFDIGHLRARRVSAEDFYEFSYVIAMDGDNYSILESICPPGFEHKLQMLMDFAPNHEAKEVPDPYYGGAKGFERVLDMVEEAAKGLLEEIRLKHL
jgi:protein-tyrosine phosphatase